MKKIKSFIEKVELYLSEHRWCNFFINVLYIIAYFIALCALVFYSMALLDENVNAQNILTVVLAFSVFNNLFRLN